MKPSPTSFPSAADGWAEDHSSKHHHHSAGPILSDIDISYAEGAAGGNPEDSDDGGSADFLRRSVNTGSAAAGTGSSGNSASQASANGSAGFVINVTYDQAQSSLPAGFVTAVNDVVAYYESVFTAPVTVNIDIGYGEIDGQQLGTGALGESETYIDSDSYSQAVAALKGNDPSAVEQSAYATLPATSPFGGDTLWMATAQEKALGLLPADDSDLDGYVGFSSVYPFSYSPTATPASNQYYFVGVVEHEFTEIMGRDSFLGYFIAGTTAYSLMDLFRYSAPGERDLTQTPPVANTAYFSVDNGSTDLENWNTNPNGDLGDWASTAGNDAYLAFSPSGVINTVTPADLETMGVLGWEPAALGAGSSTTVGSGSVVYVSSGQTSTGLTILSGGVVDVLSGGTSIDTIVSASAMLSVSGQDIDATVGSGGIEIVLGGGTATSITVNGGGLEKLYGTIDAFTVASGGSEYIESGGKGSGGTISTGGTEIVLGSDGLVTVGGTQYDFGLAAGDTISGVGWQVVEAGGTASGTTIGNGGLQVVLGTDRSGSIAGTQNDYGLVSGDTVSSTGVQVVESGGTAIGTTISNGGVAVVLGTDRGAVIRGNQYDYAAASGGTVSDGGLQVVESGAWASGMSVSNGGEQVVEFGGIASGTRIASGGIEVVFDSDSGAAITGNQYDYGLASGDTTYNRGLQVIELGGSAGNGTISSGGGEVVFGRDTGAVIRGSQFDCGFTSGDTALSGGLQVVEAGGTASATAILGGGEQYLVSGGLASGTVISNGGTEVVFGSDSRTSISGTQYNYGVANGDTTYGGLQVIEAGATASASLVAAGGIQLVFGTARGTTVNSGGFVYVESGGVASSITISGGTAEILSGGGELGTIYFSGGGGDLVFGNSTNFGGLVAGFTSGGDMLDFTNIAYVSSGASATAVTWTQMTSGAHASGTLTVSDGGHVANITLLGQYAQGNFTASNDGGGGTLVIDPPLVSNSTLASPSV